MSPTLRVVPSVAGLLALCLTSPPARATDLDLADRLTGAGDRILSGAVLDRNGNYIWTPTHSAQSLFVRRRKPPAAS